MSLLIAAATDPDVARIRDALLGAPTVDSRIKDVASLASVTLALVTLFVNRRLKILDDAPRQAWNARARVAAIVDTLLLSFVAAILVALAPLLVANGWPAVGRLASTLPALYLILWCGFLAVAALQSFVVGWRILVPSRYSRKDRLRRRTASGRS